MKSFAETVGPRLKTATEKLMAKGWRCPSIEVGAKALGEYGLTIWAVGHLAGCDHPLKLPFMYGETMEAVLDQIDEAVENAPLAADKEKEIKELLDKLTPSESAMVRHQLQSSLRAIQGP